MALSYLPADAGTEGPAVSPGRHRGEPVGEQAYVD
jgi:hypothetical protein